MGKTILWLSIAAIASVLLLVPTASTPVAFADDDDDDDGGIKQCVEDCVENFVDAIEECSELELGGPYEFCVLLALFALTDCIIGSDGNGNFDGLPVPEPGCLLFVIPA